MLRDDATVLDMLKACRLVVEFRGDMDERFFSNDLKTQEQHSEQRSTSS